MKYVLAILLTLTMAIMTGGAFAQKAESKKGFKNMKMNAGIVTKKLAETKKFYAEVLGFGVTFENEFYLLMHTQDESAQISFLLPEHPTQQPLFQKAFAGAGMYLTIEVDDVDAIYKQIKDAGVNIEIDIRNEPWGDRHFAIKDPNGIGIDIVKYSPPDAK